MRSVSLLSDIFVVTEGICGSQTHLGFCKIKCNYDQKRGHGGSSEVFVSHKKSAGVTEFADQNMISD